MKKLILLLFITASVTAYAQPLIQGMYAYTDVNASHPLDSVQACDSIYFVVSPNTATPPANYGIYLDDSYYESYAYSLMQQYPAGGYYKVFFKIPCNITSKTFHYWAIGTSSDFSFWVYSSNIAGIIQAYQQNKQGTVTIYDNQGRFIKSSSIQDYQKGLQPGVLYIYNTIYSDNTIDKGKFVIE